jgi:hypothetical protein
MKQVVLLMLAVASSSSSLAGQAAHPQLPERAIRRTIPLNQSFERGLAAGTRDSSGHPGPKYWQLRTDYTLKASYAPATGVLTGNGSVVIHNPSPAALGQVVLQLAQNRFTATGQRMRTPPSVSKGITVTRLSANGAAIDVAKLQPDWAASTVLRVPLPDSVAAGKDVTLDFDWTIEIVDVPEGRGGARGGRRGPRVVQATQWYPSVAMFDDLRGWDDNPHLGMAEFYHNYGSYDVTLNLPAGWLVGATGSLTNAGEVLTSTVRERLGQVTMSDSQVTIVGQDERGAGLGTLGGDRLTWRFTADSVNDFAWAASGDYVWEATRATIPGRGAIPVHILYLPEHERYRQTGAMARHALEFYSNLWFPYAWSQFTQADGPEGGMEYPMITMSGPAFGVTDHELGHQWWPMMVGTNETMYGWMDEGFNQYMNRISAAAWKQQVPDFDSLGGRYGSRAGDEMQPPMMWNNNYAGPQAPFVIYQKAPMMLSMLGAIVGDGEVQKSMKSYANLWRFKHPSPWDFMFAMNRYLQRDLGWFWYYWLFTTESSDGGISAVATKGGKTVVTVRQNGEMPAPVVLKVEFAEGGPAPRPMKNAVIDGATAIVTWPVDVWFSGQRTFNAELTFGAAKIARITLDPGVRFPDRDRSDNSWSAPAP